MWQLTTASVDAEAVVEPGTGATATSRHPRLADTLARQDVTWHREVNTAHWVTATSWKHSHDILTTHWPVRMSHGTEKSILPTELQRHPENTVTTSWPHTGPSGCHMAPRSQYCPPSYSDILKTQSRHPDHTLARQDVTWHREVNTAHRVTATSWKHSHDILTTHRTLASQQAWLVTNYFYFVTLLE